MAIPHAPRSPTGEAPFVRLSGGPELYTKRARRLRALAAGHSLEGYLELMALLVEAQAHAAQALTAGLPAFDAAAAAESIAAGQPVYPASSWRRDPAWRQALDMILGQMSGHEAMRLPVRELGAAGSEHIDAIADGLLSGALAAAHPGQAPLVAAGLQVYWSAMATRLEADHFVARGGLAAFCPVCGSAPVAGTVRSGSLEHGLRYLRCSLCDAEWHMPRVQCSSCGETTGIDYFVVEGSSGAVKAEACNGCHSYLKQMYVEKDPAVDPLADDLASLNLDLLMAERNCLRSGPNLLFVPGQEQTDS